MRVLVEWYRGAHAKGHVNFIMDVPDFPFMEPKEPNDPERRAIEEYAARVTRHVLSRERGETPIVTVMESVDRTMPPEGSPHWLKTKAEKGINEVD